MEIKEGLKLNSTHGDGYKWQIIESPNKEFLSADCYGENLLMAISPQFVLRASKSLDELHRYASDDDVFKINSESMRLSKEFYFSLP